MENATKALLIAAGVLLGILIISLGATLFASLSNYVETSQEQIKFNDLNKFNTQFMKYINTNDAGQEFELTIQDVVSAANLAYDNNVYFNPTVYDESPNEIGIPETKYIAIFLDDYRIDSSIKDNSAELLRTNLGKKYECRSDNIIISEITGRIYRINFRTIN